MNFFREIVENIALVIVMALVYSLIYPRLQRKQKRYHFLAGGIIAAIAVIGMMAPAVFMPGIIFDGRSIILLVSGFFLGPFATGIAWFVSSVYRVWIGGGGMIPGLLVISTASLVGVIGFYWKAELSARKRYYLIFFLSYLVHILMVLEMFAMPAEVRFFVVQNISLPVLLVYPPATFFISWYLMKQEERADHLLQLKNNESRLQGILANMPMMLDAFDGSNRILAWNKECEKVTGYTQTEAQSPAFMEQIYPDPEYLSFVYRTLKEQHGDFFDMEFTLRAKNGELKTVSWSNISRSFPVQGWATWAIGMDVTKRKATELKLRQTLEEKQVLLKEIHHRVKNNMQTIASMINLQIHSCSNDQATEYLQAASDRIMAMGLLHKTLYQSEELNRVNLASFVSLLVDAMKQTYLKDHRILVSVDVEDIFIDLDTGIPLGLIMNELFSNSLKHAFHPQRSGHIYFRSLPTSQGRYLLEIEDDGIGLSQTGHHEQDGKLGLQLVQNLVKQIRGTMEMDLLSGTKVRIEFPVPQSENIMEM